MTNVMIAADNMCAGLTSWCYTFFREALSLAQKR